MIEAHSKAIERRSRSGQRILKHWPESPELHELDKKGDGSDGNGSSTSHPSQTDNPTWSRCASTSLTQTGWRGVLRKEGHPAVILADFRGAQALLEQIDDMKELDLSLGLEAFGLRFWRGFLMPAHLHRGHFDLDSQGIRVRAITPSVPPESPRK